MKPLQHFLLFFLVAFCIGSCTVNKDFSKRKYLQLKAPIVNAITAEVGEESVPIVNSTSPLSEWQFDASNIEKRELELTENGHSKTERVTIIPKEMEGLGLHDNKEITFPTAFNDPIVVDSIKVNEDTEKAGEKESRTRDPKRTARIILTLLLSILVATAGIWGGIYIMQANAPNGSFFSAVYFFFVAIAAIALMLVATLITLFLLISVFAP